MWGRFREEVDGLSHMSRICLCHAGLLDLGTIRTRITNAWRNGRNRKCGLLDMWRVEKGCEKKVPWANGGGAAVGEMGVASFTAFVLGS